MFYLFLMQFHGTFKRIISRSKIRRKLTGQGENDLEKNLNIKLQDLKNTEEHGRKEINNSNSCDTLTPKEWVTQGGNSSPRSETYGFVQDNMLKPLTVNFADNFKITLSKS